MSIARPSAAADAVASVLLLVFSFALMAAVVVWGSGPLLWTMVLRDPSSCVAFKRDTVRLVRSAWGRSVVGAVLLGSAVTAGCGSSQPSSEELAQRFIDLQREADPNEESSDAVIRQSLDNGCNVTQAEGSSMDVLMTKDPQYLPKSVTREEYVKIMDDYCASRR